MHTINCFRNLETAHAWTVKRNFSKIARVPQILMKGRKKETNQLIRLNYFSYLHSLSYYFNNQWQITNQCLYFAPHFQQVIIYVKKVFRSAAKLKNEPIHMPPERLAKNGVLSDFTSANCGFPSQEYCLQAFAILLNSSSSETACARINFHWSPERNFEGLEQFMESIIYNNGLPDLYLQI